MNSKRTFAIACVAFLAITVVGCNEEKPAEVVSPNSEGDVSILGTWNSASTSGVTFHVEQDSFGLAGRCASNGSWEKRNDSYYTQVLAVPEIGGCPETMTLNVYEIEEFGLAEDGTLYVTDSEGNKEIFSKS